LLGEQAVLKMTVQYIGKFNHVYFANLFTSVKLITFLVEKKVYACHTDQLRRKDWRSKVKNPKALKLMPVEAHKLQYDGVTAVVWHNKYNLLRLSTNSDNISNE
jgi:hypothetical protein